MVAQTKSIVSEIIKYAFCYAVVQRCFLLWTRIQVVIMKFIFNYLACSYNMQAIFSMLNRVSADAVSDTTKA